MLDRNLDDDRSHVCTNHGPEKVFHLRRLAIGLIKYKPEPGVAQTIASSTAMCA
jgi:hypothetical protein